MRGGLFVTVAALLAASYASQWARFTLDDGQAVRSFSRFFNLDAEANVPTWFSSVLMFSCALMLFAIGERRRAAALRFARHWYVLGAGFVAMSLDEVISMHERLGERALPVRIIGPAAFNWIFLGGAVVLVAGLLFVPFLRNLPRASRTQMLLAGAVFLSGTLGLELAQAPLAGAHGMGSVHYVVVSQLEESLELIGIALFAACLWHDRRSLAEA